MRRQMCTGPTALRGAALQTAPSGGGLAFDVGLNSRDPPTPLRFDCVALLRLGGSMEATSENELVDEDRLSELVSKELDRLVNDRFDKFAESLKDFGEKINSFHQVLMDTRKEAEKMLERERLQHQMLEDAIPGVDNSEHRKPNDNIALEDNYIVDVNDGGERNQRSNQKGPPRKLKMFKSQSAPTLESPGKHENNVGYQKFSNHRRRRNSPRQLKPLK